jgi:hypothetical protein
LLVKLQTDEGKNRSGLGAAGVNCHVRSSNGPGTSFAIANGVILSNLTDILEKETLKPTQGNFSF